MLCYYAAIWKMLCVRASKVTELFLSQADVFKQQKFCALVFREGEKMSTSFFFFSRDLKVEQTTSGVSK